MARNQIQAIVLDVDGVLTDGRLYYGASGEVIKVFYVQDGSAIKEWQKRGGKIAFLSGRESPMVQQRAQELGVEHVIQGRDDKLAPFQELARSWGLAPEQICYVGDDDADIAPMKHCGLPVAVANATEAVKQHAEYITRAAGGRGAVQELIEYLLEHDDT